MPSALQASRDILAHGVARVRSGLDRYGKNLDTEGPEIAVQPFDARNVSTPAALIKLGTSIAAARRHRANYEAARGARELDQEKTRAEIARLRSEADYYTNRATGSSTATTRPSPTMSRGKYKDLTIPEANALMREEGMGTKRTPAGGIPHRGEVSAANMELNQIKAAALRAGDDKIAALAPYHERIVAAAKTGNPAALARLGISQGQWTAALNGKLYAPNAAHAMSTEDLVGQAYKAVLAQNVARIRSEADALYNPDRQHALSVIHRGTTGFQGGDTGDGGVDYNQEARPPENGFVETDAEGNPIR